MSHWHPIFPHGERVAVVERVDRPGLLGVAMRGGRFVVNLPEGYDELTQVGWVDGWIFVMHPKFPPMLADTTTGKLSPMNPEAAQVALARYELPRLH